MTNIRSFRNMTGKNAIDIKWEIFNGAIPKNKIVKIKKDYDSIELDNLECIYINCEKCNKIIENPDILSRYCSKKCQISVKVIKERSLRHNNINNYLSNKYSIQKNTNKEIDYDLDHLISLGTNCFYCDVQCSFGNDEYKCDTLTFDRKNSDISYIKDNVVQCCWFCNVMKNITLYDDWMQFINFVKDPEITVLDLSDKKFYTEPKKLNICNVYGELKRQSPKYYSEDKSARNIFLNLVKEQDYKDSIFYFFPIIYLERNCLWNMSIDAIDSTLPKDEKHRPYNIQIIPKIFNYGKHVHTQEEFLKEWNKRGFKTDFSKCTIKLPNNYYKESCFNKIITN